MDQFADLVLTPIALFSGRPLAVSVALTLIFSALGLWLILLRPAESRFLSPLRRAAKNIKAVAEADPEARQNAAEKIFAAEPALAEPWRRFSAALDVADGQLQSFSDPAEFFGLTQLNGHSYPKWSSTLAGVFLTIGLFFTFVGLSAALLQLGGNGHDSLSPGELKNAVQGILAVSSAKFITSIAGILCYIFWSIVARAQGAAQTHAEEALLGALRRLAIYVAPEMVLRRQLRLMESQHAGISGVLQQFSAVIGALPQQIGAAQGDVSDKFSQGAAALDRSTEAMAGQVEAIGARIAATLQGFESRLTALPTAFSSAADEGARALNRQMRENFAETAQIAKDAAQAEAAQVSARFEALSASLAAAALAMSSASESSRETVERGAQSLVASGEQAAARLKDEIGFLAQSIAGLAARLDQAERALAGHTARLEASGEIVASSSQHLAQSAGALESAAGAMENAAAPLTSATLTFREAMAQLSEAAQRIETISRSGDAIAGHIAQFGAQMNGALAAFDALPEKIQRSEAAFGGDIMRSSEALSQAALGMSANFAAHQAAMAAAMAGFEQKMAQAPAAMGAAAEQAGRDMSAKIHHALDGVTVAGEQAAARLHHETSLLAQGVASFAGRLDQAEQALASHAERLEASGEIVAASSKNLALAAGAMESAAAPLTTATLTFRGAMSQLSEAAQRIDVISRSGDAIASHIAQFGAQMSGALAAFDALPEKIQRSEAGFGGEMMRSSEALNQAALAMSANFSAHQAAMAAAIASFEQKIAQAPAALGAAAEQTSRDLGAKIQGEFLGALDSVAAVAHKASASGADLFAARIDEISRALGSAADRLLQASDASGASLAENRRMLEAGAEQGAQIFAAAAQNSSEVMTHVVERFADSARGLSLKLAETALGLDAQNSRLEQAGSTLGAASTALAEAAGAVASSTPPLAAAGVSLERALGAFAETGERVSEVALITRDAAENFGKTAGAASETLKSQGENFGQLERMMTATLDQLNGGVRALAQEIAQALEAYDNEIARSIGSLEAALIDMGDILDDRAAKKAGEA